MYKNNVCLLEDPMNCSFSDSELAEMNDDDPDFKYKIVNESKRFNFEKDYLSSLDHSKISDRTAVALLRAENKLGNRYIVRKERRENGSQAIKDFDLKISHILSSSPTLVLQWDGKLLTLKDGSKVDKIPVSIFGDGVQETLAWRCAESGSG